MKTKISLLREEINNENWKKAFSIASKFNRLGEARGAILDAHMVLTSERFAKQIFNDTDEVLSIGISVMLAKFSVV